MGVLVSCVGCCLEQAGACGKDGQGASHACGLLCMQTVERGFAGARGCRWCELGNRPACLGLLLLGQHWPSCVLGWPVRP